MNRLRKLAVKLSCYRDCVPIPPVRWVNLHRRSGSCINPAAEDTTATAWVPSELITATSRSRSKGAASMFNQFMLTRFSIRAVPALIRIKCPHSWRRIIFVRSNCTKQSRLKVIALNGKNSPRHHLLRDYLACGSVCIGNAEHQVRQSLGGKNHIESVDASRAAGTYPPLMVRSLSTAPPLWRTQRRGFSAS